MTFAPSVYTNYRAADGRLLPREIEDVAKDLKRQMIQLYMAVGSLLTDWEYAKDYWLVVPESGHFVERDGVTCNAPVVRPFNFEDIQLVDQLVIPNHLNLSQLEDHDDPRKALASQDRFGIHVTVELNMEHDSVQELRPFEDPLSKNYLKAATTLALHAAEVACENEWVSDPLRVFMPFLHLDSHHGNRSARMVEQWFDKNVKSKTNGFHMGAGYMRGYFRQISASQYHKFIAFDDLFESTGWDFLQRAYCKEDLVDWKGEFDKNPWVPIAQEPEPSDPDALNALLESLRT